MVAVAIIAAIAIGALVVVAVNSLNQAYKAQDLIREAESDLRIHLQAQVDDLHAKILSHNWAEYGNTVGQRSAFDRSVAAEVERHPHPFGESTSLGDALERHFEEAQYEDVEGPVVG